MKVLDWRWLSGRKPVYVYGSEWFVPFHVRRSFGMDFWHHREGTFPLWVHDFVLKDIYYDDRYPDPF